MVCMVVIVKLCIHGSDGQKALVFSMAVINIAYNSKKWSGLVCILS